MTLWLTEQHRPSGPRRGKSPRPALSQHPVQLLIQVPPQRLLCQRCSVSMVYNATGFKTYFFFFFYQCHIKTVCFSDFDLLNLCFQSFYLHLKTRFSSSGFLNASRCISEKM